MDEQDVRQVGSLPDMKTAPQSKAGRKWFAKMQEKQEKAVQNLMEGRVWNATRKV